MARNYIGFRFSSGNKPPIKFFSEPKPIDGEPHKHTGRYSISGELVSFTSKAKLDAWRDKEDCTISFGKGGGIRKAVTKHEARKLCWGISFKDFEKKIEQVRS